MALQLEHFFSSNSEVNFRRKRKPLNRQIGVALFGVTAQRCNRSYPGSQTIRSRDYEVIRRRRALARLVRGPPTLPLTLIRYNQVSRRLITGVEQQPTCNSGRTELDRISRVLAPQKLFFLWRVVGCSSGTTDMDVGRSIETIGVSHRDRSAALLESLS